METREFLMHAKLEAEVLETLIQVGWLKPTRRGGLRHFSEVDLTRAQFIRELKHDLGINNEGISAILDLVDQLHGLRRMLRGFVFALSLQPKAQRQRIARQVHAATTKASPGWSADAKSGRAAADNGPKKSPRAKERRFA